MRRPFWLFFASGAPVCEFRNPADDPQTVFEAVEHGEGSVVRLGIFGEEREELVGHGCGVRKHGDDESRPM